MSICANPTVTKGGYKFLNIVQLGVEEIYEKGTGRYCSTILKNIYGYLLREI